ncbi:MULTISPECIES: HNH endonuclease family protein [Mycobacterium]|nr:MULTISPECIES: HNH endonuclease family protein [Mycobacterium]
MNRFMAAAVVVLAALMSATAVGCSAPAAPPGTAVSTRVSQAPASSVPSPATSTTAPDTAHHIAQLLTSVPVVEHLPKLPGYQRGCKPGQGCVFGPAWTDTQHTGCDTRNRVLAAQLTNVVFKPGTRDCKVIRGILNDPYTGATLEYGGPTHDDIEIDHVFALNRAWDAGAAQWTADQRLLFANDTDNLLAVSGAENRRKSDSGPDEWLPPNRQFACRFIEIYLSVAVKYRLTVTQRDKSVAESTCPP